MQTYGPNACMYLYLQSNTDLAHEAANVTTNQGCLLCTGSYEGVKEAYLALEKEILFAVKTTDCAVALFAAFFVFNVNYPASTNPFFQFLEYAFLKVKLPKKQALARLAAKLNM